MAIDQEPAPVVGRADTGAPPDGGGPGDVVIGAGRGEALPANRFAAILTAMGVTVTALATLGGLLGWLGWSNGQWIVVGATAGAFLGLVISLAAHLRKSTRGEPVAVGASVTALATALAALGGAFGWWTAEPDVQAAVVGLVTAAAGLMSAILTRSNTSPSTTT